MIMTSISDSNEMTGYLNEVPDGVMNNYDYICAYNSIKQSDMVRTCFPNLPSIPDHHMLNGLSVRDVKEFVGDITNIVHASSDGLRCMSAPLSCGSYNRNAHSDSRNDSLGGLTVINVFYCDVEIVDMLKYLGFNEALLNVIDNIETDEHLALLNDCDDTMSELSVYDDDQLIGCVISSNVTGIVVWPEFAKYVSYYGHAGNRAIEFYMPKFRGCHVRTYNNFDDWLLITGGNVRIPQIMQHAVLV